MKLKSSKTTKTLVLFDHDGTLCQTHESAFESIKYAFRMACSRINIDYDKLNVNFEKTFSQATGTTEKNLVRIFCFNYGIPFEKIEIFEHYHYTFRAMFYKNLKSINENTYDTYYPDSENFINICNHHNNISLWLVTGNPKIVIKERIAKHLENYFTDKNGELLGSFGDEALSREELIKTAIEKAKHKIPGFIPKKDILNFYTNVIYIGDSEKDFFSGLKAHVRTIWIPSRALQEINNIKNQDSLVIIKEILKDRIQIVNQIDSKEVLDMLNLFQ